jgi:hypothetical protein
METTAIGRVPFEQVSVRMNSLSAIPVESAAIARLIHRQVVISPVDSLLANLSQIDDITNRSAEKLKRWRTYVVFYTLYARSKKDTRIISILISYYNVILGENVRGEDDNTVLRIMDRVHDLARNDPGLVNLLTEGSIEGALAKRVSSFSDILSVQSVFFLTASLLNALCGKITLATPENFNEEAYLSANPDVAMAVANGSCRSGLFHFNYCGKSERRKLRVSYSFDDTNSEELIFPIAVRKCDYSSWQHLGEPISIDLKSRKEFFNVSNDADIAITLIGSDESHDGNASFIGNLSIGSDLPEFNVLRENLAWTTGYTYLLLKKEAIVDIRNGTVLLDRRNAWGDSCLTTVFSPGAIRRSAKLLQFAGKMAWVYDERDIEVLDENKPLMLCFHWASLTNYGHRLANSYLSVYYVLDALKSQEIALICPKLPQRVRGELLQMGVPENAIIETGAEFIKVRKLIYPSPLSTRSNVKPSALSLPFFDFMKQKFTYTKSSNVIDAPEYVYVTRRGFPSQRNMQNEDELVQRLEQIGFKCVAPHELSFAEQMQAFSNAKVVIGQFGAALWNLPFTPRGGAVIEIMTNNYIGNEYFYISHLMNHKYVRVMVTPTEAVGSAYKGHSFNFSVPIDEVLRIVTELM